MVKYFSEIELEDLFSVIDDIEKKLIYQTVLELGCRNSEILSLRKDRIKHNYIKIKDEKKGVYRDCYISEELAVKLEKIYWPKQSKIKPGPRMFCYYSGRSLNNWLKDYCEQAQIPDSKAHMHTFRHTFIVFAWDRKWNPKSICDQTGDTLKTLVDIYSDLSPKGRQEQWKDKPLWKDILEENP